MSNRPAVSVLVADDHPLVRRAVERAVDEHPQLSLVGSAENGHEALKMIAELGPDVALLDVGMPGHSGLDILRVAGERRFATRIAFFSALGSGALVHEALVSGAAGFIAKESDASELCLGVLAIARGEIVVSGILQGELNAQIAASGSRGGPQLSHRELDVLRLAATGLGNNEIGTDLHISASTVKTHLHRAFEKLGAPDRTSAVAEALRQGLFE